MRFFSDIFGVKLKIRQQKFDLHAKICVQAFVLPVWFKRIAIDKDLPIKLQVKTVRPDDA